MIFKTINPSTEEWLEDYHSLADSELEALLVRAHQSFLQWSEKSFDERGQKIQKLAQNLEAKKESLAQQITLEMGKPIKEARSEIEKCAWLCQYYSEMGPEFLRDQNIPTEFSKSYVSFQPLGVILGIMPWNFPFWQVLRFSIPTLLAGNTVVVKHAPNVMGCAFLIEKLFLESGFHQAEYQNLVITHEQAQKVMESSYIQGVSLTGSERAGKQVAQVAGHNLKKVVLELGGSDPYLILEDADIQLAAQKCVQSRFINGGQTCIAAKRFIVTENHFDRFKSLLFDAVTKIQFGDPRDENTDMGPLAREDLRKDLHHLVLDSKELGAKVVTGGVYPSDKGYFYTPTLITHVTPTMPVFTEETFGPVVAVSIVKNNEQALEWANQSRFGLGAAIFSQNEDQAEHYARNLVQAGCVFINDFVRSDPRLPFGGIKNSGIGRELSSFGIHEFVNIKTVVRA